MRKLNELYKGIDYSKLIELGFYNDTYSEKILDDKFEVIIERDKNSLTSKVIDSETKEEYVLVDVPTSTGEFVGRVREEYDKVIDNLISKCTDQSIFKSSQTKEIIAYVSEKYEDELEYLWEKFPDNAIYRNARNKKWYAAILTCKGIKVGLNTDEKIEILDLRYEKGRTSEIVDNKNILPGYHMNKDSWITIRLDNSVSTDYICDLIDNSRRLSGASLSWVIPADTKTFNIIEYFKKNDTVVWHQLIKVHKDDIVYIYIGAPYSAIMFKCLVEEAELEIEGRTSMKLKLIETYGKDKYTLNLLKENGLSNVRSQRSMPDKTVKFIEKR